ncbi:rhodanese-like domain-containing protein [Methylobacterium sp. Leaf113]|uniref:rhodanese-like domain-containing protein n=1 Tax=Methylobacterium sp. Leaf113 TaxID=1736259 RepID=UPI0009EB16BB|nr:rhodanese-like domain-containing protein [Methylobacterium sp. Leaf113]
MCRPPVTDALRRRAGLVLVATLLGAAAPADSPVAVPEPAGYWDGALQGYTPKTLAGATVIDAEAVEALIGAGNTLLIDVSESDPTPRDLAPGRLWRPIHRAIPDSIWLPGAGSGTLSAQDAAALAERIETLTRGDRTRPVVTYCHPDCWGSWNLGKRLVTLGYRSVHWFPAGIEGWQERHDTGAIRPDAAWTRALKTGGGP